MTSRMRLEARLSASESESLASPETAQCRLKYCTSRSCFSAAARDLKVPRLRRLPVFGLTLREYSRYSPERSLRIMTSPRQCLSHINDMRARAFLELRF